MTLVLSFMLILSTIFVANADYSDGHSGQPHCKTNFEMETKYWRNNNDPTTYWVCTELNTPATAVDCPVGEGFVQYEKGCVEWRQWHFEEQYDPPSMA